MVQRLFAVTLALASFGCSGATAPEAVINRVEFRQHTVALWAGDVLATSILVFKTNGQTVANPQVAYSSSDTLVASVDSAGKVTAHVAGSVRIVAAVGSIADTLNVTVLWPPVAQVFFGDDSLLLFVGDTFTTSVTALNIKGLLATNAVLTYTSFQPSIATVDGSQPAGGPVATCNWQPRIAAINAGRTVIAVAAEGSSDSLRVIITPR